MEQAKTAVDIENLWRGAEAGRDIGIALDGMSVADADEGVRSIVSWTFDKWPEAAEQALKNRLRHEKATGTGVYAPEATS